MDAALNVKFGADVQGLVSGLKVAESATNSLKSSVKGVSETFVVQNNTLNQSVGYMRQQQQAAERLAQAEKNLASATKDATNAQQSAQAFSGLIEGANKAFSAIRRLAFILPGIGIAGLFNLAFEGIASVFKKADDAIDEAAQKLKEYKKIVDQTVESNSKEAAIVDVLVGKIQSGTLSRQETVQAIKELQRISPDYFGKLSTEKISIEEVTKAYGNYNNALLKTIETQIRIAEITDLVKQRLSQQTSTPDAARFIADLQAQGKSLQEIAAIVTKGTAEDIAGNAKLLQGEKFITDEQLKQSLLQAKIPAGVQTILRLLQQEQDILKDINNVSNLIKLPDLKPSAAAKDPKDPLKNSVKFNLDLDTSNFDADIKTIPKKLDQFAFNKNVGRELMESLGLGMTDEARKLVKDINDIFKSALTTGFVNIGEAIGNAIGSGKNPIEAAGKAILSTIGDLIENIGKALIEYGVVKAGLDNFLGAGGLAIPGGVAIAAGIAAIALGQLVKSLSAPRHAFAEGGIVTGPTNALIGEAGPEVVFPLDKLNRFINGNTQNSRVEVVGNTVISGPNLITVFKRATNSQNNV